MTFRRQFHPVTNRIVFDPERTPSPEANLIPLTNRVLFEMIRPTENDDGGAAGLVDNTNVSRNGEVPDNTGVPDGQTRPGTTPPKERPPGPLSKPNSGGYSLKEVLGWDQTFYKLVQDGLRLLCVRYLNTRVPFHEQNSESVTRYLDHARRTYPILDQFTSAWPAEDFAAIYLKNSSADFRRKLKQLGEAHVSSTGKLPEK